MKRTITAAVIAASLLFSGNALVFGAETPKIGVFDMKKIMVESKTIQAYRQKIEKELEPKRKAFSGKQEEARLLEEKLKKEGNTLPANDRKVTEEKLVNEIKDLKRLKEDFDLDLQKIDRELTQQAFKEIDGIIKDIAGRENYTIIFERSAAGIAYLKDPLDITGKIIKEYDK